MHDKAPPIGVIRLQAPTTARRPSINHFPSFIPGSWGAWPGDCARGVPSGFCVPGVSARLPEPLFGACVLFISVLAFGSWFLGSCVSFTLVPGDAAGSCFVCASAGEHIRATSEIAATVVRIWKPLLLFTKSTAALALGSRKAFPDAHSAYLVSREVARGTKALLLRFLPLPDIGGLMRHVDPVERAFQLAKSGQHHSVDEIRKAPRAEGHSLETICGPSLRRQLREMIRDVEAAGG